MVVSSSTASNLINNILLGNGVTATNITTPSGDPNQIGSFTGGTLAGFPLDKGIILCTGNINDIPGSNLGGASSFSASGASDADLNPIVKLTLGSNTTNDAATIEFDFVPTSSKISFTFIFGSEEYPKYICNVFNDAFGFFLSGPNPNGGSYVKKNLAVIPGTNIPIL